MLIHGGSGYSQHLKSAFDKVKSTDKYINETDFTLDSIAKYCEGFFEYAAYGDQHYNKSRHKELLPFLPLQDYCLLQHHDFAERVARELANNQYNLWPDKPADQITNLAFTLLLNSLYQTLFSARKLLLFGYEWQAKSLFRVYIEVSSLALLFLLDYEFCTDYCRLPRSAKEDRSKWATLTRPSTVYQRLQEAICAHPDLVDIPNPVSSEWRARAYNILSK